MFFRLTRGHLRLLLLLGLALLAGRPRGARSARRALLWGGRRRLGGSCRRGCVAIGAHERIEPAGTRPESASQLPVEAADRVDLCFECRHPVPGARAVARRHFLLDLAQRRAQLACLAAREERSVARIAPAACRRKDGEEQGGGEELALHCPENRRSASWRGSPASRIDLAAASTGYSTRWKVAVKESVSSIIQAARGSPSRGCPMLPGLTSQRPSVISRTVPGWATSPIVSPPGPMPFARLK